MFSWAVKRRLKLKSKYSHHVMATIEYTKTIDDFDDLIDPRTLALRCLSPESSTFVLGIIDIEEKKSKYSFGLSLLCCPFFLTSVFLLQG